MVAPLSKKIGSLLRGVRISFPDFSFVSSSSITGSKTGSTEMVDGSKANSFPTGNNPNHRSSVLALTSSP